MKNDQSLKSFQSFIVHSQNIYYIFLFAPGFQSTIFKFVLFFKPSSLQSSSISMSMPFQFQFILCGISTFYYEFLFSHPFNVFHCFGNVKSEKNSIFFLSLILRNIHFQLWFFVWDNLVWNRKLILSLYIFIVLLSLFSLRR